ncbi:MAG: SPFH domain-containing protein [Thermoanaerobaculia bacterium]
MGILDFIKGELLEIIEWTDDSRDILSWRFPDEDKAIKRGAQLIVRESQVAQFVYLGEFGDTFGPGKHSLTTDNIPILTRLKSWKYGLESPFKADVYFLNTRLFTGNKWGTANPIMMRDEDFGIVCARCLRHLRLQDRGPEALLEGGRGLRPHLPPRRVRGHHAFAHVSCFADALASSHIPVLDAATRYTELGDALLPINPVVGAKYGLAIASFIVENVGATRGRGGDRQALLDGRGRQPERLRQVPDGEGHGRRGEAARAAWRRKWRSASPSRSR